MLMVVWISNESTVVMLISRNFLLVISSCCIVCGTFVVCSGLNRNKNRASNWWNLANVAHSPADPSELPPHIRPLTKKQQKIIHNNPGSFGVVVKAAKLAVEECGRQMSQRRWNCPLSTSYHSGFIFGKITKKGSRETAFLHALTSASLTYSVARACSEGLIHTCSCGSNHPKRPDFQLMRKQNWGEEKLNDGSLKHSSEAVGKRRKDKEGKTKKEGKKKQRRNKMDAHSPEVTADELAVLGQISQNDHNKVEWQWGGCSDNNDFGIKFSKEFIDGSEKDRDMRCSVNLHNNEAGRQHVNRRMKPECKCHGMSGSCSIKTCWMRLPAFSEVAGEIKDKFDTASKVDQGNDITGRIKFTNKKMDLVYFEESPLFCESDVSLNFSGVKGRLCNASSQGEFGCEQMCCGRGHRSETYEMFEKCNCSFQWCCKVRCDKCQVQRERHVCL